MFERRCVVWISGLLLLTGVVSHSPAAELSGGNGRDLTVSTDAGSRPLHASDAHPRQLAGTLGEEIWLSGGANTGDPGSDIGDLREAIEEEIAASGKQVGLVIKHIESGRQVILNDDTLYPMASVYKIPILVEVYRQVIEGRLSLNTRVELTEFDRNTVNFINEFAPGLKPTLRDLATMMIIYTDSSATDMLLRMVGAERVTATMRTLGLESIRVNRTVEDLLWDFLGEEGKERIEKEPYRERIRYWTTSYGVQVESSPSAIEYYTGTRDVTRPSDMARLLEMIIKCEILDARSCSEIKDILYRQRLNFALPRLLPPGTPVGHKTGNLGTVANDVGVITLPDQTHLVVVILTKFVPKRDGSTASDLLASSNLIARIARHAYDFFVVSEPTAHDMQAGDTVTSGIAPFSAASEQEFGEEVIEFGKRFGRVFAVAAKNLETGRTIRWDHDKDFFMAGLAGLPIVMETLRNVDDGAMSLKDRWILSESDRQTFGGGFLREFGPGLNPSVDDLVNLVSVRSDASARDMLLKRLGRSRINAMFVELGAKDTAIDRTAEEVVWDFTVSDGRKIGTKSFEERYGRFRELLDTNEGDVLTRMNTRLIRAESNRTTASDQLILLEAVARETFGNRRVSLAVLDRYRQKPVSLVTHGRVVRIDAGFFGMAHELRLVRGDRGSEIAVAVLSAPVQSSEPTKADLENWDGAINLSIYPVLVSNVVQSAVQYLQQE